MSVVDCRPCMAYSRSCKRRRKSSGVLPPPRRRHSRVLLVAAVTRAYKTAVNGGARTTAFLSTALPRRPNTFVPTRIMCNTCVRFPRGGPPDGSPQTTAISSCCGRCTINAKDTSQIVSSSFPLTYYRFRRFLFFLFILRAVMSEKRPNRFVREWHMRLIWYLTKVENSLRTIRSNGEQLRD